MTEEEKSIVCDELCKHRSRIDNFIKAAKTNPRINFVRYVAEQKIVLQHFCSECPLNEVADE